MKALVVLCFIIGLLCLCQGTRSAQSINWDSFSAIDLENLQKDRNIYLVHFAGDPCDDLCLSDLKFLANNEEKFLNLEPRLQFKAGKLDKKGAITLQVEESSAIFVFYLGHAIRVDNNGPTVHQRSLGNHIEAVLIHRPLPLTNKTEIEEAFSHNKGRIHVFYGSKTSKYWVDLVLTSKFVDTEVYVTSSQELAQSLNLTKKDTLHYVNKEKGRTLKMLDKPKFENMVRFIEISKYPIPTPYHVDHFLDIKTKGYPILFIKSKTPETEQQVVNILKKNQEGVKSHLVVMTLTDLNDSTQKKIAEVCTPENKETADNLICIVDYSYDILMPTRFVYKHKDLDEGKLVNFILDFIEGTAKPLYKNEKLARKYTGKTRHLNTRNLNEFLTLKGNDILYLAVHYYTDKTPKEDLQMMELVSKNVPEKKVKFGRYNLDRNEKTQDEGLYFGGVWNSTKMIKFEDNWTPDAIRTWIKKMVAEQDKVYADLYTNEDL